MQWQCSQCNFPVKQPCCRIETAKLKNGVLPYPVATNTCILINTVNAAWERTPKSSKVAQHSTKSNKQSTKITAECKDCNYVINDWIAGKLVCPFDKCPR